MIFIASLAISPVDISIIGCYIVATTLFGVWLGRGQSSTTEFFLGSRDLPSWALLLSIVATETSTVTFLSVPGKAFVSGGNFSFLQLAIGYIIGRIAVLTFLLPLYFRHENSTAYAVLQRNFGVSTRKLASIFFLGARTLGDGLRLFLTALALQQVVDIPFEVSVLILAVATAVYALCGGVRSVIWNDCLQFAVYMTGALIVIGLIWARLPGGFGQYWQFASETGRLHMFDFQFLPSDGHLTLWAGIFGGGVLSLATHGADQLIVQRYLCAKNQRAAGWALFWSGPIVFLQFALFLAIGVGLACYFTQFDPSKLELAGDQAFARFIVDDLPIGVRGVILAAVFAAAMSTLSSSVNSSASSLLDDLGGDAWRHLPDVRRLLLGRSFTLLFTMLQAAVAIGAYSFAFGSSVVDQALAIAGFSAGLLLGLFFVAIVVGRIPSWQANAALICGAVVIITIKYSTSVSGYWYAPLAASSTFCVATLLSKLLPSEAAVPQGTPAEEHS
ncbi:sodium/solute symporter [Blastopirellula sp. JC732]|uniref:Sodium/solute symporter n=1 Tax=Blastopirellula sediminis TaxID=2894196 RepID=A0A9X1MLG9_9BACT|nr:sodium/solute symporter [Blastopirellula sediminis]MCC9609151.1 sodium/solute symporter [Blastopirellula sediminis]MCC9628072.1 sodium/solute symporter [Blastopirellula sediminis]